MTQVTCVMTRIQLRHVWLAPALWLQFWHTRRHLAAGRGLLAFSLLFESPRKYFTISIWADPRSVTESAKPAHVLAVRFAKRWSSAIWSTQWHLTRLSPTARSWPESHVDWSEIARMADADHGYPSPFTQCTGQIVDSRLRSVAH